MKIRGTASHVAEKYLQLARDAQSSGDPVSAENYYQHAEHYFRLIAAAQEQFRQTQPYYQQQPQQAGDMRGNFSDDGYDDDGEQPIIDGEPFAPREPQSFYSREPHQPQPQQPQQFQPHSQQTPRTNDDGVERLPSFITGGQQPPQQAPQNGQGPNGPNGPNGQNGFDNAGGERFPLHRRRRRHRGPRDQAITGDGDGPQSGQDSAED